MLRVARELLGVNQGVLASTLGLNTRAIQRVEANKPSLSLERQQLFVEYFRGQGLVFRPPGSQLPGWSVIECFNRGEEMVPARLFRAARTGLDQSQQMLGDYADLGTMTIRRIESAKKSVELETRQFLVDFLKTSGVHFLPPEGAMGWGIRFANIIEQPAARHPRLSVQKRKREGSTR